jgi:hypothetical protein
VPPPGGAPALRIALLAPLHGPIVSSGECLIHGPIGQPWAETAVIALVACWPSRLGGPTVTIRVGCDPPDWNGVDVGARMRQAVVGEAAVGVSVEWAEVVPEDDWEEDGEVGWEVGWEEGGEGDAPPHPHPTPTLSPLNSILHMIQLLFR